MDMTTAMNSFHRPAKHFWIFIVFLVMTYTGCADNTDDINAFGKAKDVTEDLYHRIKAGMFEPGIDPYVCRVMGNVTMTHFNSISRVRYQKVRHSIVRISWERGAFRVKGDDMARVIIYMDEEALFSHVQVAAPKQFGLTVEFREYQVHPFE